MVYSLLRKHMVTLQTAEMEQHILKVLWGGRKHRKHDCLNLCATGFNSAPEVFSLVLSFGFVCFSLSLYGDFQGEDLV